MCVCEGMRKGVAGKFDDEDDDDEEEVKEGWLRQNGLEEWSGKSTRSEWGEHNDVHICLCAL